jgi:hypothetical protein
VKLFLILFLFTSVAFSQERTITILTDKALDGKGGVLRDVRLEVRNDKITSIQEHAATPEQEAPGRG